MSANIAVVSPPEETTSVVTRNRVVCFANDDLSAAALRKGLEGSNLGNPPSIVSLTGPLPDYTSITNKICKPTGTSMTSGFPHVVIVPVTGHPVPIYSRSSLDLVDMRCRV